MTTSRSDTSGLNASCLGFPGLHPVGILWEYEFQLRKEALRNTSEKKAT